jgi:DNA mismatch repair protein MutL
VGKEASGIRVFGLVAALAEQGPKRGPQNVFVNRRIVKDKTIAHAVIEAYSVAFVKERSPEVHLFIEMEPDQVDVNVHPTKAEVRFRNQSGVHEAVRRALGAALGQGPAPELQLRGGVIPAPQPAAQSFPGLLGGIYPNRWAPVPAHTLDGPVGALGVRPMIPLGQFRDTFIIAIDDEGIAIIDQHVAHERVLFERVMQRLTEGRLESQLLLEPLVVELSVGGCQVLLQRTAELARFGFEISEFGGNSVRLAAVPVLLMQGEIVETVRALAQDLDGFDRGATVDEALKRIAALTACHAAVKANAQLTHEKMAHLLEELRRTAYSTVCPHGRPVMLRLTRREIEKNFQRI